LYLKKLYIVDNGFIKVIKQEEESVFIELIRKTEDLSSISYWKEYGKKNGKDVDFVVLKNNIPVKLIQVTYASDKAGINKREIEAIVKASKELNCEDALIITWDYEGEIVEDGLAIKCMLIWK
jgi:predicted AAA+ superfamily ATPase